MGRQNFPSLEKDKKEGKRGEEKISKHEGEEERKGKGTGRGRERERRMKGERVCREGEGKRR